MKAPDWAEEGLKVILTKPDPSIPNCTVECSGTLRKPTGDNWFYLDDSDWSNNHRIRMWNVLRPKEEKCSSI